MKSLITGGALAAGLAVALMAAPAFAQGLQLPRSPIIRPGPPIVVPRPARVPEIDAASGLAALAAVGAAMAFARERRRRG